MTSPPSALINRSGHTVGYVLIDPEDRHLLASHRWYIDSTGYASRGAVRLHRQILGLKRGDGLEVDHINGDKLDNRRENLRIVSHAENTQNVRTKKGRLRGVYCDARDGVWYAQVKHAGKRHHLGRFKTPEEAAAAASAARLRLLPGTIEEMV